MLIIGLTGGIGSGKSTVEHLFADLGVPTIDADEISRQLVMPGSPALEDIRQQLGTDFIRIDGSLDRERLREAIFAHPHMREALNAIIHPRVRAEIDHRLAKLNAPYTILSIPLLLESGMQTMVDRILVVDATTEDQIRRTVGRDGVPESQVRAIINTQVTRAERLKAADDVIDNRSDPSTLQQQVDALHRYYLQLAAGVTP